MSIEMKVKKALDKDGYYIINNYDKKQPFASFLSAVAGVEGIPMWSFYVNRGQAISSIGIKDKGNSIMEFFPANEAYKMVYTNGFRTFIKMKSNDGEKIYEPFSINNSNKIIRDLKIKNNEIELVETNDEIGLIIKVKYFTVPNDEYAAMARKLEVINNSSEAISIDVLDGIASILPYGTDYLAYKQMSNLLRSWMEATIVKNGVVEYKLRTSTADTTEVAEVENSYFYVAMDENEKLLNTVVDAEKVFGYDTSLSQPIEFEGKSLGEIFDGENKCFNKVPCAFTGKEYDLIQDQKAEIYSYIGYIMDNGNNEEIFERICRKEYFSNKEIEANKLIGEIVKHVDTKTAYPMFDEYIKQCYVDNVLRGGYPLEIGNKNKKTYYVYSRKHGDLERDYNFFNIEPNYYSQGNGNFRDINQNRRLDVYLHPFVGTENIKLFMNLIQMDGYNPLVIKGKNLSVEDKDSLNDVLGNLNQKDKEKITTLLSKEFTLGELYAVIKKLDNGDLKVKDALVNAIIDGANDSIDAEFGEGFWVDHWTYNLDLIEDYLNIYPDKINELLMDDNSYKFYNSPEYVLPRKDRYVLNTKGNVRQYLSLKKKEVKSKWLTDNEGNIYNTNLATKLFMLASIKFMTLDPYGIAIEMEAGKPGWNDAMNGLPGLIGSSTAELFELKRLLQFIKKNINVINELSIPNEFYKAIMEVNDVIKDKFNYKLNDFEYWDSICDIKEEYRDSIKDSVKGVNSTIASEEINCILDNMITKINEGITKLNSLDKEVIPTFLYYDVKEYAVVEGKDKKNIIPKKFEVNYLPDFLEGPTRYLKTDLSFEEKTSIYNSIKQSGIYDEKLKMYKTSESLEDITFEIGRARGFTAGWLERESIFMHMEFKYVLELLKNGLYEEFFNEINNVLPPFMDENVYGRSILENSSFIASSANPDSKNHGRGFVARLTGTTVELLNMWKIMMGGKDLFAYENNELIFKLSPILPGYFFDEKNEVTTNILGSVKVVYINDERKDTFGINKGKIEKIILINNENLEIETYGDTVLGELAEDIRAGKVKMIKVIIA